MPSNERESLRHFWNRCSACLCGLHARQHTGQRAKRPKRAALARVEAEHVRDVVVAREVGVRAVLVADPKDDVLALGARITLGGCVKAKRKVRVGAPRMPARATRCFLTASKPPALGMRMAGASRCWDEEGAACCVWGRAGVGMLSRHTSFIDFQFAGVHISPD